MTLHVRILLTVTGLLALAVLGTTGALTWSARQSLLAEAEETGVRWAELVANSSRFALEVPPQVEATVGQQMLDQATILAHLVSIAEAAGLSPAEITAYLRTIMARGYTDALLATDEEGLAYLDSVGDGNWRFSPDPVEQPEASLFWPLLTGELTEYVGETRKRATDDELWKYAGVAGIDKPRIVEVGYRTEYLERLAETMDLDRFGDYLVQREGILAFYVVDAQLNTLAADSAGALNSFRELSARDVADLRTAIAEARPLSHLESKVQHVVAPIRDERGRVLGAVLLDLSIAHVQAVVTGQLVAAGGVAAAVLLLGLLASLFLSRRVTDPVTRLTEAAAAVETQAFEPGRLAPVAGRTDELGRLARVFEHMAREVVAREQRLAQQIQALRVEIDETKRDRAVAELTESESFRALQDKARRRRARSE
jgi:adenylate cyclase